MTNQIWTWNNEPSTFLNVTSCVESISVVDTLDVRPATWTFPLTAHAPRKSSIVIYEWANRCQRWDFRRWVIGRWANRRWAFRQWAKRRAHETPCTMCVWHVHVSYLNPNCRGRALFSIIISMVKVSQSMKKAHVKVKQTGIVWDKSGSLINPQWRLMCLPPAQRLAWHASIKLIVVARTSLPWHWHVFIRVL